eukprot:6429513-Karenia_brevis.AAC.1
MQTGNVQNATLHSYVPGASASTIQEQVGEVMHLAHNVEQRALDMQDSWQGMAYQAQGARA